MIPAVMPTYARYDIAFDHGEGAYLWDTENRRFLDFGAGIAVAGLGHCHPHLVEAIREQAGKLMHTSNLYHIPGQERLAELLVANTTTAKRLMEKMQAGEINPALMDTMSRWRFQRSTNEELKTLADSLFGQPSGDRAEVMQTYHKALENKGSIEKGQQHFTMICSVCHIVDGVGNEIGPDITDVRNKPAEALLSDILDPNRAVEARWTAYTVETTDGRTLLGLVVAETADSVTLKGPGINETLPRSQIKSMTESGQSLMPVGLEAALSPEQMSDLLAYLRER